MLKGVRRAVRRGPNRSGDGYVRDTVGKFEGGFVFFGGGSRKGGFGRTPEPPPLVTGLRRAEAVLYQAFAIYYFLQTMMEDVAKVHTLFWT